MRDSDILRLIEEASNAAVKKALVKMRVPQYVTATVTELTTGGYGVHDVIVDGDVDAVQVMDVTTGTPLNEGDRVTVVFAPPHQALIIGRVSLTSDWVPYTPTFSNIVFDETTLPKRGRFTRTGNTVVAEGGFTLDGSHDSSGAIAFTLPLPAHLSADGVRWLVGGRAFDTSSGTRWASLGIVDPATDPDRAVNFYTTGSATVWGGTVPFDWANGDVFDFFVTYETANDSD